MAAMVVGERHGRLTAVSYVRRDPKRETIKIWQFQCDCGNLVEVRTIAVRCGNTKSCGCLNREKVKTNSLRHGHSRAKQRTPEHRIWLNMKQRCGNPKNPSYERYGGRGIFVCEAWKKSFERFLADVGPRPSLAHSIDRIDNSKGYEPGNVRWATAIEQGRNRRNTVIVTYQGKQMSLGEACERSGLPYKRVATRLDLGWDSEMALRD